MSFSVRDEAHGPRVQRHVAQHAVRAAPQPAAAVVPRHGARHPALQPRGAARCSTSPAASCRSASYLARGRYGRAFVEHYIVPMGAAIWSTDPASMLRVPGAVLRALPAQPRHAHRRTTGRRGARSAAARRATSRSSPRRSATASACDAPVESVRRPAGRRDREGARARGRALRRGVPRLPQRPGAALLADPTRRRARGARRDPLPAQRGGAAHRHAPAAAPPLPGRLELPRAAPTRGPVALTYNMNILQRLDAPEPFLVTLNRSDAIDPARVISALAYHHPVFTPASVAAQARHARDQRRAAHLLLRRVLALRLPRGRRRRARWPPSAHFRAATMHSALYTGRLSHRRLRAARRTRSATGCSWRGSTSRSWTRCSAAAGSGRRGGPRSRGCAAPTTSAMPRVPLDEAVRDRVERETGRRPAGPDPPAHAPAHLRLRLQPGQLLLLLRRRRARASRRSSPRSPTRRGASATPTCCRPTPDTRRRRLRFRFGKRFHVSPFMPMDLDYDWRFGAPGRSACACTWRTARDGETRVRRDARARAPRDHAARASPARSLRYPVRDAAGARARSTGRRCACG